MAIAGIFNVPGTPEEFAQWGFDNAAHHVDINRVIFQITGTNIASFVLDPLPLNDMGAWLYQHQQMHTTTNGILGVQGFDLTDVDFNDKGQLAGWIQMHANEHFQWANQLLVA